MRRLAWAVSSLFFIGACAQLTLEEDVIPCAGYIEDEETFVNGTGPIPIICNETPSRWGPPEHQSKACCTDVGRLVVQVGEFGGFDIINNVGTDYRCVAYTEALRATLCDPRQGQFVRPTVENTTALRICRESCDAVFNECGLPGVSFPKDADYSDGTSFCLAAWGGFDSDPCDVNDDQFPCSLDGGLVVEDSFCLSIITPTEETLNAYRDTGQPPDPCLPEAPSRIGIIIVVIVTVTISLSVCGVLIYINARHRQAEEDFS